MKDLTKGPIGKTLFWFALPLLLSNILMQANMLIDSAIVGRYLGKEAFAAIGSVFPVIFVLASLQIGLTVGGSVLVSQFAGAKKNDDIKRTIDTLFTSLLFVTIGVSVLGIIFQNQLFKFINIPADVMPAARLYMSIYLSGNVLMVLLNTITAFMRGMGDSKTPMYFALLSNVLNIIFDLLFILVFKWGVAGAAWASVLSQGIAGVIAFVYCYKHLEAFRFSFLKLQFNFTLFFKSINIGMPTAVQQFAMSFGMMTIYKVINSFGTNTMAGYTAGSRIDSFPAIVIMELSTALAAFSGQNFGANLFNRIQKALLISIGIIVTTSLIMGLLVYIFPSQLLQIFTTDLQVILAGKEYLFIIGAFYFSYTGIYIFGGIFQGMGKTFVPMLFTIISLWAIRIPLCYYLSALHGSSGIWWGIVISWTAETLFCIGYYIFIRSSSNHALPASESRNHNTNSYLV